MVNQPQPYYADDQVTLWLGDALEVLSDMPSGSVNCCVTSPPYYGLRDYGVEGQYGLEASPAEYVEQMRAVFSEVRRVLADDGTLWLNLGDTYSTRMAARQSSHQDGTHGEDFAKDWTRDKGRGLTRMPTYLPEKNLIGVPWRVAFALQDDGWILRNDNIWAKTNGMPDPVTDRLTNRHEYVFMFSKSRRYWFDLDPIREPLLHPEAADGSRVFGGVNKADALSTGSSARKTGRTWGERRDSGAPSRRGIDPSIAVADSDFAGSSKGRNPGDVWTYPTQPFAAAHFAVMPVAIAERCIQSGCKPSGAVLDPFSGSGTTGLAAGKHARLYVGIDLNREYLDLSLRTRLAQSALLDGGVA